MSNAEGGICFVLNLFLATPQRVFDFFTGWLFDLIHRASPNFFLRSAMCSHAASDLPAARTMAGVAATPDRRRYC
ncbi:MAG: hypothetical protein IPK83_08755 [Planctomycetes bacterium]|nr:hypothetical protein [Planctomycetota bacterium]